MRRPKAVLDSNVLVSILKGSRSLAALYLAFKEEQFTLVVSPELLKEIGAVLYRPSLRIDHRDIKELFRLIKIKAIRLSPKTKPSICRDPKDNFLLALTAEADADFLVTGDKDLLVIKSFSGIPIITPRQFCQILKKT